MATKVYQGQIEAILQRTNDLIQYCRSKFDTAPIPSLLGRYPGHVNDDKDFCSKKAILFEDIKRLLINQGNLLGYEKFCSEIERTTYTIPLDKVQSWSGMFRCRCWWDTKDQLQSVVDYFDKAKTKEQNRIREEKSQRRKQLLLVIITALNIILAFVTNVATNSIPLSIQPYTWLSWPSAAVLVLISLVVTYRSSQ